MFELEDYSTGYHDGFLVKYADSCGPSLDLYMTDSLQDMLDIDIRSEIATVVGGSNELASLVNDLPSSLESAIEAISAINNTSNSNSASHCHNSLSGSALHATTASSCSSSAWMGAGLSLSSSNDFYPDVGACVNPISVMPLISSSLLHKSPKVSLNANGLRSTAGSPPPTSPNANETKSHLTFSPAQMKVSANAIRNEQLMAHIPKQIVAISSTVTAGTTAPATLATNSALQRKSAAAVEAIKKDLGAEMRKTGTSSPVSVPVAAGGQQKTINGGILTANGVLHSGVTATATATAANTIKLAPGIGGLTFANSVTYNKLKQLSAAKSPIGAPVTAHGTIVLKRDRDSSPLHNMATLNGSAVGNGNNGVQQVTKLLGRSIVQAPSNYTLKSIASALSPLSQRAHSPATLSSAATISVNGSSFSAGLTPIIQDAAGASSTSHAATGTSGVAVGIGSTSTASNGVIGTITNVKSLNQKIKTAPVESEWPKPAYSYSCLIAMALKNSRSGSLPVSEIYSFMCEHFPYFKTAPSGWKNSVRHNLSLNKCFEKIEKPATNGNQRKGCLWAMNPDRIAKMEEEVQKWTRRDPTAIRNAMVFPEHLEALERGEMKHGSSGDSDVELDSQSEIEETSDLELEQEMDDTIVDNLFVEEDIEEADEEDDEDMAAVGGMLGNGILLMSAHNGSHGGGGGGGGNGGNADVITLQPQSQSQRDFDIEVDDIYDSIDLDDDKDAIQMAIAQGDIIELSPADLNTPAHVGSGSGSSSCSSSSSSGYQSPKRARLNINYSIGPAGELEKHIQIQQQQRKQQPQLQSQSQLQQKLQLPQGIKQIKVHPQTLQQLQQKPQQHIVVQTITNGGNTTTTTLQQQHFQQITTIPNHNRRKMQLVSRIA